MKLARISAAVFALLCAGAATAVPTSVVDAAGQTFVLEAGHPSLAAWRLPSTPPHPEDNAPTAPRVELGKKLFFDTRVSGDGNMSCASCHNPMFGWSDGLPTAKGFKSQVLGRATPTIINTGFNGLQMWDGRKKSLEDQALGPMEANVEMNTDLAKLFGYLRSNPGYRELFAKAYPGQEIGAETVAKAIASFERTVVSNGAPFDRWLAGDSKAISADQLKGFELFVDPKKGNCAACHSGPNFTDNGFHNLGLASWGQENPDVGRFAQKPIASMKGAFKTPTVREAANTAPYFHDGSAKSLLDVMKHYNAGGEVKTNLSKDMRPLHLSNEEMQQIVAFMEALSTPPRPFELPALPR